ncbi:MAG: hypothetical protein QM572_10960 [Nocardioides sp.]|uniref:hypothetical protein n=1 Tax=Nocardioides sp. TaxID=35761 RepID=UPI0039E620B0
MTPRLRGRLAGLMAAVVLATTAAIGLSVPFGPPAAAAYCTGDGVGVVVEFGDLGGGAETGCGTAGKAAGAFTSAGVTLEQDADSPGFVCRVESKPAAGEECMATNAYWALFVSKQGGSWSYATQGVYTQPVKSGDSVAFVWQSSKARTTPATAPQPVAATPSAGSSASAKATASASAKATTKATSKATKKATSKATRKASATATATVAGTATTTASATATSSTSAPGSGSPTPEASATTSASTAPTSDTTTVVDTPTGQEVTVTRSAELSTVSLPVWAGPAAVVLLAAVAGGVVLWRKRRP